VTDVEHREMGSLYRSLPRIALTTDQQAELLALCTDDAPANSDELEVDLDLDPAANDS
jgi:hypothetical protein